MGGRMTNGVRFFQFEFGWKSFVNGRGWGYTCTNLALGIPGNGANSRAIYPTFSVLHSSG